MTSLHFHAAFLPEDDVRTAVAACVKLLIQNKLVSRSVVKRCCLNYLVVFSLTLSMFLFKISESLIGL